MDHLLPVHGTQPACELFHDVADLVERGLWMVVHPLAQRRAFHILSHVVQELPAAVRFQHTQHVGVVQTLARPFLVQELVDIVRVVLEIDRRCFQHHLGIGFRVQRQIHLGAVAGVQFAQDTVAVQHHAGFQRWREWQLGERAEEFVFVALRQIIDEQQLRAQVIVTFVQCRLADDGPDAIFGCFQVFNQQAFQRGVIDKVVNAVGGKQVGVAFLDHEGVVVDVEMHIDSHGATEIALVGTDRDTVVTGHLFQFIVAQAVDARVADVKQVGCG